MIARNEKFLLSVRRSEDRAFRIIGSAGQKLQSEKWMGGAAFAQIDFDGIRLPVRGLAGARYDKIEREASITPASRKSAPTLAASRVIALAYAGSAGKMQPR